MSWDIETASEEWLIDLCHRANKEGGHIGGPMGGDQAVKLSDHIAAKFGLGVCASKAAMQEFAYNTVDRNIVRIPKVYRYLESKKRDPHGCLFMEYIPGQNLQGIDLEARKDILPRIAIRFLDRLPAVNHLVTYGGDYGARTAFKSIEDMNVFMNSRLQHLKANIDLTPHLLVLCHGDICRRNIILADDGSICFLDWAYSGFYPRFFELATISCAWYDSFQEPLVREVESAMNLTDEE
ncbi:hypothetical protein N7516_007642 [Penicillium verrucosum]|uniref:uncharacterized protein n=1 Tax=Penicillium verrucosum TaxID=60171 RepID=UPI00254501A0|nr:uncharacterized protein N7516_007642 [Penicillium verrucosum]KAJ5933153.1 hypothetical protein N7516_007642 [Penicillium verrucosum]